MKSFLTRFYELYLTGEISKKEGIYELSPELEQSYGDYLEFERHQEEDRLREIRHRELQNKLIKYFDAHERKISLESEHFFLEGRHLDQFTKFVLDIATKEIIVVNPYVNECDISKQLIDAKERGLNVKLLARHPKDNNKEREMEKIAFHKKLTNEGVIITYDENVHAKIITVDGEVAIVSSMNIYSESSAGKTWEAGLVTLDDKVVDEVYKSILKQIT